MKWNVSQLKGLRFGRLLVLHRAENRGCHAVWNCICDCGTFKEVRASCLRKKDGTRSCGCLIAESQKRAALSRSGDRHYNWNGGKTTDKKGYVYLSGHNIEGKKSRYMLEHRFVMETYLGRKIHCDETVHHKNGIRNDNRIENLELKASSHGEGQSIPDLITWAKEVITRYQPELLK